MIVEGKQLMSTDADSGHIVCSAQSSITTDCVGFRSLRGEPRVVIVGPFPGAGAGIYDAHGGDAQWATVVLE